MYVTKTLPSTSLEPVPKESPSKNGILGKINGSENSLPKILPNVVSRLSAEDYNNLRLTCSKFAKELISVRIIANDYPENKGDAGKLQKNKNNLLYSAVTGQASHQTIEALAKRKNGYLDTNTLTWAMTCRYPGAFCVDSIKKIFNAMPSVLGCAHDNFNGMNSSTFYLGKKSLNEEAVSAIFNKADIIFHANKKDSGLVLASMMSSLCDHLAEMSAADKKFPIPHEVLARLRDSHSSMLLAGDIINKFTPPSSGIIELAETQKSSCEGPEMMHWRSIPIVVMITNPSGYIFIS
nr:hypothetical protein [Erwinia sp. Ejp617]